MGRNKGKMKTFLLTAIILAVQYMGLTSSETPTTTYGPPPPPTTEKPSFIPPYQCPPTVTWGGGNQIYRFVAAQEFTRCDGKIAQCIYHAHLKFYCFSGDTYKDYEPKEMYAHTSDIQPEQDVFTGPFGNPNWSPITSFSFSTDELPYQKWTLCPGNYAGRLVVQGIEIEVYDGTVESAGDCETLLGFPKTEFHLGLGDYITEAFGRIGFVLDKLTLIKTPSNLLGDYPSAHTAGGPFGAAFDATPPANIYGPCVLFTIYGNTTNLGGSGSGITTPSPANGENFIKSIGFHWSCLGVPESFL